MAPHTAPARRIVYWQTSGVLAAAALFPCVVLLVGQAAASGHWLVEWTLRSASMLTGGLSVVLPSWVYLAATNAEHRAERLLLLAWVKIVGTIVLMTIGIIVAPRPGWLLGGLAIAYLGHALGSLSLREEQRDG